MRRVFSGFILLCSGLASLIVIWAALPLLVLLNHHPKANDITDMDDDDPGIDID